LGLKGPQDMGTPPQDLRTPAAASLAFWRVAGRLCSAAAFVYILVQSQSTGIIELFDCQSFKLISRA